MRKVKILDIETKKYFLIFAKFIVSLKNNSVLCNQDLITTKQPHI